MALRQGKTTEVVFFVTNCLSILHNYIRLKTKTSRQTKTSIYQKIF